MKTLILGFTIGLTPVMLMGLNFWINTAQAAIM